MTMVIGVRFRTAGKIYYFGPKDIEFRRGDHVIVETARGVEYGTVVLPNMEVDNGKITQPLKTLSEKPRLMTMNVRRETVRRKRTHIRSVRRRSSSTDSK